MDTVTQAESTTRKDEVCILHGVPFKFYARLTRHPENSHLRMAYYDGTLEIVSPTYHAHEGASRRLSLIITLVARALGLRYNGTGSLTIHRAGDGPNQGVGKEPDLGFYIGSVNRFPMHRELDLNAGDPPPDLWVEVDHRASSRARLPIYAQLGVPEVWQYRVLRKTIKVMQLIDGKHQSGERSLSLPLLTPQRVFEALAAGETLAESDFVDWLQLWIPAIIARSATDAQPE